jgi:phage terminase large subunit GpA-like protein
MYLSTQTQLNTNFHPTLIKIVNDLRRYLEPRERLRIDAWADKYVQLPASSAKKGFWITDEVAYTREPLLSLINPNVTEVTWMSSAQILKTTVELIFLAWLIDNDPAPFIVLQPTIEAAQIYSKSKFEPMISLIEPLKGKIGERKSRDFRNTMLYKEFPGGFGIFAGANSPVNLAQHSVKYCISEDVDRIPLTAGEEGDPVLLAEQRTESYKMYGRKLVRFSTPTDKNTSRIFRLYNLGDQRKYYVPCPRCGFPQVLFFDNMKWEKETDLYGKVKQHFPDTCYYECVNCKGEMKEKDKRPMVAAGNWIAKFPERSKHHSYHISRLYSTISTWSDLVREHIDSEDEPDARKVFVNTGLGEVWESEEAIEIEIVDLLKRAEKEKYLTNAFPYLPNEVLVITAQVDVQSDRLELLLKGWRGKYERWTIAYEKFSGDIFQDDVWDDLIEFLQVDWAREDGVTLRPAICLIDSGFKATRIYERVRYMRKKLKLMGGIHAIKGRAGINFDVVPRSQNVTEKKRMNFYYIGVDAAKDMLLDSLNVALPGPGYNHFTPAVCDVEYFEQLTAEKKVTKYHPLRGFRSNWIKKKANARNEVLDLEVYAIAAIIILNPAFDRIEKKLLDQAKELAEAKLDTDYSHEDVEPETVAEKEKPLKSKSAKQKPRRERVRLPRRNSFNGW